MSIPPAVPIAPDANGAAITIAPERGLLIIGNGGGKSTVLLRLLDAFPTNTARIDGSVTRPADALGILDLIAARADDTRVSREFGHVYTDTAIIEHVEVYTPTRWTEPADLEAVSRIDAALVRLVEARFPVVLTVTHPTPDLASLEAVSRVENLILLSPVGEDTARALLGPDLPRVYADFSRGEALIRTPDGVRIGRVT